MLTAVIPGDDFHRLLLDLNADLSDSLDALGRMDVSAAIGLLKGSVQAVREILDKLEDPETSEETLGDADRA